MSQYSIYADGQLVQYTDGNTIFRTGSRDKNFVIDKALTPLGFDGVESIDEGVTGDWMNIDEWSLIGITGIFRDGVRDGNFVLDETITPFGFDGVESMDGGTTGDWIKIYTFG